MHLLITVDEVIEELGGNAAAAKLLGVGYSSITNWRMFDRFPASTYVQIQTELNRRDKVASDYLWRMRTARKPRSRAS
jgi:hypothetical protein